MEEDSGIWEELKDWLEEGLEARWMVREMLDELTTTAVRMAGMYTAVEMLGELRWVESRDRAQQLSMLRETVKLEREY